MVPIHGGVKTELEEPKRLGLRPSGPGIPKELGTEGASRLRQILSERIDYVHDPSFERGPTSRAFAGKWTKSALDRGRNCMSSAGRHAATFVAGNTLTMNEERRLFLRFNYARYRIAGILKRFADQPLTARAARELLEWHTESLALRDLLVEMNMPLVLAMALRS